MVAEDVEDVEEEEEVEGVGDGCLLEDLETEELQEAAE
jgi:hypothetical protein